MEYEDFKQVTLLEYLAKADLHSETAVILNVVGQFEDGTPVMIILPDDLLTSVARVIADRISLPGANPTITPVKLFNDED